MKSTHSICFCKISHGQSTLSAEGSRERCHLYSPVCAKYLCRSLVLPVLSTVVLFDTNLSAYVIRSNEWMKTSNFHPSNAGISGLLVK